MRIRQIVLYACPTLGSPFFACDYFGRYPNAIGPGSKFQANPLWRSTACDPALAQAPARCM